MMPLPAGVQPQQTLGGRSEAGALQRRDVDQPTVTSTSTVPDASTTVTVTANGMTSTNVQVVTATAYITLPPQTIYETAAATVSPLRITAASTAII